MCILLFYFFGLDFLYYFFLSFIIIINLLFLIININILLYCCWSSFFTCESFAIFVIWLQYIHGLAAKGVHCLHRPKTTLQDGGTFFFIFISIISTTFTFNWFFLLSNVDVYFRKLVKMKATSAGESLLASFYYIFLIVLKLLNSPLSFFFMCAHGSLCSIPLLGMTLLLAHLCFCKHLIEFAWAVYCFAHFRFLSGFT